MKNIVLKTTFPPYKNIGMIKQFLEKTVLGKNLGGRKK